MKLFATNAFEQTQSVPIFSTYCAPISSPCQGRHPMAAGQMNPAPKPMICWSSAWYISWLYLLLMTLWVEPAGQVWGQTISTVAGNGTTDFSGDSGPATLASVSYPTSMAVDASGNLYIADQGHGRIRKVTVSTGLITTVAGNETHGLYEIGPAIGDGGLATLASLGTPSGVAVDASGNFYIADQETNRIRKVTVSTGLITTVAGNGISGFDGNDGPATLTSLRSPTGVAVDGAGNIYIADTGNNRIRKVTASTGIISTVAGNGNTGFNGDGGAATSASLYNPNGVALDKEGNIYIADTGNNRIRKVNVSTGIISTVAGNGSAGFSGDGGAATAAALRYSYGVAVDGADNIYIADLGNNRIRKVTASAGIINTVAGNGTAGFSGDGGAATEATLRYSYGVAIDGAGNIYIADTDNHRIRQVTPNTAPTVVTTIPSQTATMGQPFSYSLPAGIFTDDQTPSALVLSVTGLPAGLSFTAPGTISGIPTTATGSPFSLTVTATDPGGLYVSTTLTLTVQPEIIGGADLTPILNLPQGNFAASGPESIHNLTMTLSEQVGKSTSGVIVLTLTAPLGYSLGFDPALSTINVTGGTANPVSINNAIWEVQSRFLSQLTLVSIAGQRIGAGGVSVIGLSLTRSSASVGSANLTVNINDDATNEYDSNSANNIFVRILNSL